MRERVAFHRHERHTGTLGGQLNWLRAGVLGANDGIVSTAGAWPQGVARPSVVLCAEAARRQLGRRWTRLGSQATGQPDGTSSSQIGLVHALRPCRSITVMRTKADSNGDRGNVARVMPGERLQRQVVP